MAQEQVSAEQDKDSVVEGLEASFDKQEKDNDQ